MIINGRVTNVYIGDVGSELTVDAPLASTTLTVDKPQVFNESGGMLELEGASHAYTSVNIETGVITLSAPSTVAALIGDSVYVLPRGATKWALVDLDDLDEGTRAMVPFALYDRLDDGIRDLEDEESVLISDEKGYWEVVGIGEEIPIVDGSFINPATLPEPEPEPVVPPASSPTLTTSGMPSSIAVRATDVEPGTIIDYYVSTVDGFAPDPASLYASTKSLILVITSLPDGSPLVNGTDYFVRAVARNSAGSAAASPQVVGHLDQTAIESIIAAELVAGFILTGRIQIGQAYIDADEGIVLPQPDGSFTRFPVDGLTPSTISGFLIASAGLTVQGNANFYGLTQMFGTLRLTSGITDPTTAAALGSDHASIRVTNAFGSYPSTSIMQGMTDTLSGEHWVTPYMSGSMRMLTFDKVTGVYITYNIKSSVGGADMTNFWPAGICRIGSTFYMLGYKNGDDTQYYVIKLNSAYEKIGEFPVTMTTPYNPTIGTNGADLHMAYVTSNGTLRFKTYSTAGAETRSIILLPSGSIAASTADLGGVHQGVADFGGVDHIFVQTVKGKNYVFNNSTLARAATYEFSRANSAQAKGMHWDGLRFHSMSDNGYVYEYAAGHQVASTVYGGYTWYDAEGTTHETKVSPAQSYAWPARARLIIEGRTAPDESETDPLKVEKANKVRLYAGPSQSTMRLQSAADPAVGLKTVTIESLNGASALAPTVSNFSGSSGAAGRVVSTATDADGPLISMLGDGTWRLGDLSGDAAGNVDYGKEVVEINAIAPFTGSLRLTRMSGTLIAAGTFRLPSGWVSAAPVVAAVMPVGFRPEVDLILPASPFFNDAVNYRVDLMANGDVLIRMSGAKYNFAMGVNASWVAFPS